MTQSLKQRSFNGLKWTTIEYISLFSLQLLQLTILARLLTPADFGIFAIGTFFTTLGNSVFALGFGPALIQKQGEIESFLNTAWFSNLLISLLATILLLILTPAIVKGIFKNEEALLPALTMLSVVLISGFNNIAIIRFMKEIQLKLIFVYKVVPKLISISVMIAFAIYHKSYWALVIGVVTEYILRCFLSYFISPYKPKLELNKKKFKELYSFGGWLQLKNIANWIANYIDVIFVGSLLSTEVLGFYNRAQTMAKIPQTQITNIVNSISFPLYSKVLNDKIKLEKAIMATNDLVMLIIFPIILVTLLFSEQIILIILGNQWLYLSNTFKVLIIAISIQSYIYSLYPLLRAYGFPKYEFIFQVAKIVILLILIYPLTKNFGITGAGFSILFSVTIVAPFMIHKIYSISNIHPSKILKSPAICLLSAVPSIVLHLLLNETFNNEMNNLFISIIFMLSSLLLFFLSLTIIYIITKKGPINSVVTTFKEIRK